MVSLSGCMTVPSFRRFYHAVTILLQKSIDFTPLVWYITSMKKMTPLSVTLSKHGAHLQLKNLKKRATRIPNKKKNLSRNLCRKNYNV